MLTTYKYRRDELVGGFGPINAVAKRRRDSAPRLRLAAPKERFSMEKASLERKRRERKLSAEAAALMELISQVVITNGASYGINSPEGIMLRDYCESPLNTESLLYKFNKKNIVFYFD
jgi:hypothetical protein